MSRKSEDRKVAIFIGLVIVLHLLILISAREARSPALEMGEVVHLREVPEVASRSDLKVIIMGVDGITWDVILPMVDKGELPTIKRLMDEGAYGKLISQAPCLSPAIWTSIATGMKRDKHGIQDFIVKEKGSSKSNLISSNLRKEPALWNIISQWSEKRVGVVNWWATWPAEEVRGFVVSQRFAYRIKETVYPPELGGRLSLLSEETVDGMFHHIAPFQVDPHYRELPRSSSEYVDNYRLYFLKSYFREDANACSIGLSLYEELQPDLFAIYVKGTDIASHYFWKYLTTPSPEENLHLSTREQRRFGSIINSYYRWIDDIIGEFIRLMDDKTVLFVLSDHGFGLDTLDPKAIDLNLLLAKMGLLVHSSEEVDWSRVSPEEEYFFSDHRQIDWANTMVYDSSTPWDYKRRLYINLQGREPQGVVKPADYEKVLEEVTHRLQQLTTDSGKRLFKKVLNRLSEGGEGMDADLMVVFNNQVAVDDSLVMSSQPWACSNFIFSRGMSGEHYAREEGVIIVWGKGILKDYSIKQARIYDIAPTILYLLGLPSGRDMDGGVLTEIMELSLIRQHPVAYVSSYRTSSWTSDRKPVTSGVDEELKKRLKALGYIK
ncbi:MAG: alkaline phosphatase family protein [Candidatus Aminicenantes bacterium]|nr:alkaline phosphatase family protein [Candidatus Aminicenantes bacterium]MDH5714716.1 alkaline phosphatase family protein [Candidatus Aminicenantes bacterium]